MTFGGAATVTLAGNPLGNANVLGTTLTTTTLNTNAGGTVTINITDSGVWANGTYNLISYGTLGGNGFASFSLGTVAGLTVRQSATLTNPAGFVTLSISGDTPKWTGLVSGSWTTNAIAPNGNGDTNWKLVNGGTATDFLTGDVVLFDDSATGTTTVNISDANVSPVSTTFNNSTLSYTLGSTGGFGIATGSLTKSGTASLTINNNTNTYAGGTNIQNGTLFLGIDNALPTTTALTLGNNLDRGRRFHGRHPEHGSVQPGHRLADRPKRQRQHREPNHHRQRQDVDRQWKRHRG